MTTRVVTRALAVIDGEHYAPDVSRTRSRSCRTSSSAAHLRRRDREARGGEDYGVPLVDSLGGALDARMPEVVVDLSDEPVLGPRDRLRLASRALARGLPYVGADFRFDPPALEPFDAAVARRHRHGQARREDGGRRRTSARVLSGRRDVVVVRWAAAGRPSRRWSRRRRPSRSCSRSRAAAGTPRRTTSRTPRSPASRRSAAAAAAAGSRGAVRLERPRGRRARGRARDRTSSSSTAAAPRSRRSTTSGACSSSGRPVARGRGGLPERVPPARLRLGARDRRRRVGSRAIARAHGRAGARAQLRPRPAESRRRARSPSSRPRPRTRVRRSVGPRRSRASTCGTSRSNLADRDALRDELEGVDAETILVELKAAAIDVVAEAAAERGRRGRVRRERRRRGRPRRATCSRWRRRRRESVRA